MHLWSIQIIMWVELLEEQIVLANKSLFDGISKFGWF